MDDDQIGPPSDPAGSEESTSSLLYRMRSGDLEARERLVLRYLGRLQRWAHLRLPRDARDLIDTDDLVQETFLRALDQSTAFEPRGKGKFLAFLRQILTNQIRDEMRRVSRRPDHDGLSEHLVDAGPSPLEEADRLEMLRRFDSAMAKLSETDQEVVMLRVELGFKHRQLAEALGKSTEDAARMAVTRALIRLAKAMDESRS